MSTEYDTLLAAYAKLLLKVDELEKTTNANGCREYVVYNGVSLTCNLIGPHDLHTTTINDIFITWKGNPHE